MEEAFISYLRAQPAVAAVAGTQVNWGLRPQGSALPAAAMFLVNGVPSAAMSGPVNLEAALIQIDCWARTQLEALTLARAILSVTHAQSFDRDGVRFQGCFVEARRADADLDGTERLYRSSLDLRVWHATL